MSILKSHSKREVCRFIGAFVPQWVYEYFALYTLAKSESKTEVIRSMFENWIATQRADVVGDDIVLLSEVTQQIKQQWKLERLSKNPCSFSVFKNRVKSELNSRGLNPKVIETILKELES
jgi:hypothetical protein